jgi:DNA-binding NtrC family response regulator
MLPPLSGGHSIDKLIDRLYETLALAKLVGTAPTFLQAVRQLPVVARSLASVLIQGETGTGKELVARAIHYLSARAGGPFVAVNCGTLLESLLEDELFGHERGAFTDARLRRAGLIAQAEEGTLFLDEVDALSLKAQVSLLRVLQEHKYRAVGSSEERETNARIVVATNSLLEPLVNARAFRADLYYRLCVFRLHLPPLRERPEDIPVLAAHFLTKLAPTDRPMPVLSAAACAALLAHDWPGNIRELENAILRGSQLCTTDVITVEDLGLPSCLSAPRAKSSFAALKRQNSEDFERRYLIQLMKEHQGNISQAARAAAKERRDLGKLLKKHHIDPISYRVLFPPPGG